MYFSTKKKHGLLLCSLLLGSLCVSATQKTVLSQLPDQTIVKSPCAEMSIISPIHSAVVIDHLYVGSEVVLSQPHRFYDAGTARTSRSAQSETSNGEPNCQVTAGFLTR